MRAVAVLSVLVYHGFPALLPGGFVGVDVFFVISGFLISGIILTSLRNGTFTFADFYARRIRRIFPALFIVLTASLIAGWFILFPVDFTKLAMHAAAGAGFVSNLALWRESGYFDTASELKPLLHLWSLGRRRAVLRRVAGAAHSRQPLSASNARCRARHRGSVLRIEHIRS